MPKKYKCCLIYDNNTNNSISGIESEDVIKKLKRKKIYPDERKGMTTTKKEVLNNSKKYAILIKSEKDKMRKDGNFYKDIENVAECAESNSKQILYTMLNGNNKNAQIVKDVEELLEDVPKVQKQYIPYSLDKLIKFIDKSSTQGILIARGKRFSVIGIVFVCILTFWDKLEILTKFLQALASALNATNGFFAQIFEKIFHVSTETAAASSSGATVVISVTIILMTEIILKRKERKSTDPLFWLELRRWVILIMLLLATATYEGKYLIENGNPGCTQIVTPHFTLHQRVVDNIWNNDEKMYIPIHDEIDLDGRISIRSDEDEVYSSEGEKKFAEHMSECSGLKEGKYVMSWDFDMIEDGEKEFLISQDEAEIEICVDLESMYIDFRGITRETLEDIAEEVGAEMTEHFNIYTEENAEPVLVDIRKADDDDVIFKMDAHAVYLKMEEKNVQLYGAGKWEVTEKAPGDAVIIDFIR